MISGAMNDIKKLDIQIKETTLASQSKEIPSKLASNFHRSIIMHNNRELLGHVFCLEKTQLITKSQRNAA
jgi:hypothetical protein